MWIKNQQHRATNKQILDITRVELKDNKIASKRQEHGKNVSITEKISKQCVQEFRRGLKITKECEIRVWEDGIYWQVELW